MPRAVEVHEVPGVEEALATREPATCARRIAAILEGGADRKEVARTAALASARRFAPTLPPPHALLALGASLDLAASAPQPALPIVQACALAASEWRDVAGSATARSITGDELHLAQSFHTSVRGREAAEADSIFAGLLREGDERRLAGDALFEVCAQDLAGEGHKLTFAVGSWRLGRALGWLRGAPLLRPAVRLAAEATQELGAYGATLRDVGRSRLDVELAARNVAPIDAVARNTYAIALAAGPERIVADLIAGLKRGRTPAGYADLIATTAMERLVGDPAALEPTLFCLAVRFVLGFSRTATHALAVLQAGRLVAGLPSTSAPPAARISSPGTALQELEEAIHGNDARRAAGLATALADSIEPREIATRLGQLAVQNDGHADGGHGMLYAAWASELLTVAPVPALASLSAVLARAPKSRTIAPSA